MHISCFVSLLMTYLLLILYLFETMEMMLEKEQIWAMLLFEFKLGFKTAETTWNINAFGPGTVNKHTFQWWLEKFCKGNKSLEDKECSGQSWKVDSDKLRATIKPDPLTVTQEVAEEFKVDWTIVIRHLKQIGKVKFNKWVPHELTEKKIIVFKCHPLLFHATMINHFSIGLWRATKSGSCVTTTNDQLSG